MHAAENRMNRQTRLPRLSAGIVGLAVLLLIAVPCIVTLPWSIERYDQQDLSADPPAQPPSRAHPMGTDHLGRSILWRCALGGAISLLVGASAAGIAIVIGVAWGAIAGYVGGRTDAFMMRVVDILYGLPYILLVVLFDLAAHPTIEALASRTMRADVASGFADVVSLLAAIGGVSWLTMARVIRGQVLSLRAQPFVEAARACGFGPARVIFVHLLPNLIGPIVVYTTLTVPTAILSESFLSFLGIGVQPPLPSWGNLAAAGLPELHALSTAASVRWWLIFWPCALLGLTLLSLNFLGEALRQRYDPRHR